MLQTLDGIVIGQREIGENSCFLDILTNELGVIEVTAHGVKKMTSANAGSASLFSYATFCVSKKNMRYTINSTKPIYSFHKIGQRIENLSLAAYFCEVLKYCSASEQRQDDFLKFVAITFYELENENADLALIKAAFELRLSVMLGFMPDLRACFDCAKYESDEMYFVISDGILVCGDCLKNHEEISYRENCFTAPSVLYAMRFIVYSPMKKIYKFSVSEETKKSLSEIAEKYILSHTERKYKTLDYYKNIIGIQY